MSEEVDSIEEALSIIANRFSNPQKLLKLYSDVNQKEIVVFSVVLAIANKFPVSNILKTYIRNVLALKISKSRKSRKEIIAFVRSFLTQNEDNEKRIKKLLGKIGL